MSIANFRVKYPRPKKLSNPYRDFSADWRQEILDLPDDQLRGSHYLWLLEPDAKIGTYEEMVYFLPGAFRHLIALGDNEYVSTLLPPVVRFIAKHTKKLEKDRILEPARDCIRECLSHWTSQFIVVHSRTRDDARPRNPSYRDHVRHSVDIVVAIEELVRWEQFADLAEAFIQDLADNASSPLKAAWFLAYARMTRIDRVRQPLNNQHIIELINDRQRLQKAGELVRQHLVSSERSPTYWRDTLKLLNLPLP